LQFAKLQKIADQANIGFEEIKSIKIPYPSNIQEQEKILSQIRIIENTLIMIDQRIESIKERINRLVIKELGLSIDEKIHNRKYFFKNGRYENSSYFSIPYSAEIDRLNYHYNDPESNAIELLKDRYVTTTLGQIAGVPIMRGIQPKYIDEEGGQSKDIVDVLKTVNLKDEYIDYDNCLKTQREFFMKYPLAHVKKNDVLITSTGYMSMGKIDVYDRDEMINPAITDGHLSILRLKEGYHPYFVAYFLRSILGKQQFEKLWSGSSGQIEIKPSELDTVIIPDNSAKGLPFGKQQKIANMITHQSDEIKALNIQKGNIMLHAQNEFARLIGI
jgi:hypothetical protein